MKEQAIERLRAKGLNSAEDIVEELFRTGALTHYALSKYVGREMWLERMVKFPRKTPTDIANEVAQECSISPTTLRRSL